MNRNMNKDRRYKNVLLILIILLIVSTVTRGFQSAIYPELVCTQWIICASFESGSHDPAMISILIQNISSIVAGLLLAGITIQSLSAKWISSRNIAFLLLGNLFILMQIVMDRLGSYPPKPGSIPLIQLTLGLITLYIAVTLYVDLFRFSGNGEKNFSRLTHLSGYSRRSFTAFLSTVVLLLSGGWARLLGASDACSNWFLCNGTAIPINITEWVHLLHRFLVIVTGLIIANLFIKAWKQKNDSAPTLVSATAAFSLFLAQSVFGIVNSSSGLIPILKFIHEGTSVAVFVSLALNLRLSLGKEDTPSTVQGNSGQRSMKSFLLLTKPIVVALLLVTTYAGMVIAGHEIPKLQVTFWVMVAGFMAAGGSSAINQYIDRNEDKQMQRTRKRPIPSGSLTPAEGLAFGVGLAILSFFIMAAFVNFLSAVLTLAGIIYYVLIYSIFLKKTTVQNIVIGGGAGAIPPLVGWAAVTGSLNIPSLFLFAVVFMWTPPHFWALAIVRRKDYARAGVPMLPVVKGEKATRTQILVYTIELVILTLILPLFGLGGSIYLVSACILGFGLLYTAWKVYKLGGNKTAWKMYRHSSMYLAFLFMALMVDSLI